MAFNNPASPIEYKTIITDSGESYSNRIITGTPATGIIRMEWHQARIGQMTPTNWSLVTMIQFLQNTFIPLRYQVDDAQNLIVDKAVKDGYQWLFLHEHDVILPPDAFIRLNEWMRREDTPVVSGLYYTRSHPTEPLIYRGRGTGRYTNWKSGDLVECDGLPTGCLLIHVGLLKLMWEDSEEYQVGAFRPRRVFRTPMDIYEDPETGNVRTVNGTSDLDWCSRVIEGGYLARAGWPEFENKEFPLVVDTNLFCPHINIDGSQFPQTSWAYAAMEEEKRRQAGVEVEAKKETVYFE